MIQIALMSNSAIFLAGLKSELTTQDDIEIAGEAHSIDEALALAAEHALDVILLDVIAPETAIEILIEQLHITQSKPHLLLVGVEDRLDVVRPWMYTGAMGYVMRSDGPDSVFMAIRAVAEGALWLSPVIATQLHDDPDAEAETHNQPDQPAQSDGLTEGEIESLKLAALGKTNCHIGLELGVSTRAVEKRLSKAFLKLNVSTRTEAVLALQKQGLL